MRDCCVQSFVEWGLATRFQLADPGDEHICLACGRTYRLTPPTAGEHAVWTLVDEPPPVCPACGGNGLTCGCTLEARARALNARHRLS